MGQTAGRTTRAGRSPVARKGAAARPVTKRGAERPEVDGGADEVVDGQPACRTAFAPQPVGGGGPAKREPAADRKTTVTGKAIRRVAMDGTAVGKAATGRRNAGRTSGGKASVTKTASRKVVRGARKAGEDGGVTGSELTSAGHAAKGGRAAPGKLVTRGWTKTRRREFLECLAATMNVRASARAVGVSEQSAYRLRARDDDFRAGWREAIAEAYERLELEMLRRAIGGEDGADKADARNPDARLAMFLMKMHRETARGAKADGPADGEMPADGDELEAKLADMRERMGLTEPDA